MSCNCGQNCGSPCGVSSANTAACESLPSQIQNFSAQFFGPVVKTEVDGVVSWVLPCNLDTGLENNPRSADEGLACYFLRLFQDGIVGLTGPTGAPGTPGTNGHNAYTVTTASFTQPTLESPSVVVHTSYNPSVLVDAYVFIATSGWYSIDSADTSGVLTLTLLKSVLGATGTIVAGKLVVPTGPPGESVTGATGLQGPIGPAGPSATQETHTNGQYYATVGTNFSVQLFSQAVTFINSAPEVLLPKAGTYLVTFTVTFVLDIVASPAPSDSVTLKLRNVSTSTDVPSTSNTVTNVFAGQDQQVVINTLVETLVDGQTIALYAGSTTADLVQLVALRTVATYVKIA